jgi:hypothetical protein
MEGADFYRKENCNMIVAVGGGSPMDCAKAIGIVAYNSGRINDYEGAGKVTRGIPPLITVNTTAGTASEMTKVAIITDTKRHIKMAIVDPRITSDVAVNDPELMISMPPDLTAATGMDALTHAVEAYVSTMATPTTELSVGFGSAPAKNVTFRPASSSIFPISSASFSPCLLLPETIRALVPPRYFACLPISFTQPAPIRATFGFTKVHTMLLTPLIIKFQKSPTLLMREKTYSSHL